eukprot:CAMPEP_0114540400 /NCGR_PEP_ID=MMETSP0114-20121206/745_1 /TAXON_ID=31324 /ORGANISM="Goniomonas sp, Strain m" /LENGTH=71 /DNA_ID=CAMNT_0001724555 /DNA_START=92 /DNA_END=308 /DNA_ORIENTATION=-
MNGGLVLPIRESIMLFKFASLTRRFLASIFAARAENEMAADLNMAGTQGSGNSKEGIAQAKGRPSEMDYAC